MRGVKELRTKKIFGTSYLKLQIWITAAVKLSKTIDWSKLFVIIWVGIHLPGREWSESSH